MASTAQTIEVYSEFQRPDPFGGVGGSRSRWKPREILSPAVARNGFTSFHVAVTVPPGESYFLYVLPNPVTACKVSPISSISWRPPAGWIPDRLTELQRLPDFGACPTRTTPSRADDAGYLVDLWGRRRMRTLRVPAGGSVEGGRLD